MLLVFCGYYPFGVYKWVFKFYIFHDNNFSKTIKYSVYGFTIYIVLPKCSYKHCFTFYILISAHKQNSIIRRITILMLCNVLV